MVSCEGDNQHIVNNLYNNVSINNNFNETDMSFLNNEMFILNKDTQTINIADTISLDIPELISLYCEVLDLEVTNIRMLTPEDEESKSYDDMSVIPANSDYGQAFFLLSITMESSDNLIIELICYYIPDDDVEKRLIYTNTPSDYNGSVSFTKNQYANYDNDFRSYLTEHTKSFAYSNDNDGTFGLSGYFITVEKKLFGILIDSEYNNFEGVLFTAEYS